ncbi:GDSL esterase/lipase At5g55050 [Brachypodium distachyon]|uniref:GDSL esterase/lipase n=1 Tax=Brachypodium distachyon TaxID=15368 RepID=I1IFF8_BRADI|nr:GDSL esterase/lipase At5g55050 [Brachypodium distachyon]KQK01993.1 hypothetical protein BRADI_3g59718v3 [Brachypodium distachyon]|eukprot:XP_010236142.1 GDSL esterase/lipase At5g55050 [Brachypodium distachyon]
MTRRRALAANGKALMVLAVIFLGGGLLVSAVAREREEVPPLVPAVYVFGDSTMDIGNNRYLENAEPLQFPYGIDLPGVPTGRASNGYVMSDSIARHLGFNMSPPAYLSLTPETSHQILRGYGGVNYASGGSGILDDTNTTTQYIIPLSQQVEYFAATKLEMTEDNPGDIKHLLSESLFLISAGGNDMFAFLKKNPTPTTEQVVAFYTSLLNKYAQHVRKLYRLGARRFGVLDVPPIGCLPLIRNSSDTGEHECVEDANKLAKGFNDALRWRMAIIAGLRPEMRYSVGSSYEMALSLTENHPGNGFTEVASACCGGGRLGVDVFCSLPGATFCRRRDHHLYWDFVHSTEAAYNKGAQAIFDLPAEQKFATPINFRELVSSPSMIDAIARS